MKDFKVKYFIYRNTKFSCLCFSHTYIIEARKILFLHLFCDRKAYFNLELEKFKWSLFVIDIIYFFADAHKNWCHLKKFKAAFKYPSIQLNFRNVFYACAVIFFYCNNFTISFLWWRLDTALLWHDKNSRRQCAAAAALISSRVWSLDVRAKGRRFAIRS